MRRLQFDVTNDSSLPFMATKQVANYYALFAVLQIFKSEIYFIFLLYFVGYLKLGQFRFYHSQLAKHCQNVRQLFYKVNKREHFRLFIKYALLKTIYIIKLATKFEREIAAKRTTTLTLYKSVCVCALRHVL